MTGLYRTHTSTTHSQRYSVPAIQESHRSREPEPRGAEVVLEEEMRLRWALVDDEEWVEPLVGTVKATRTHEELLALLTKEVWTHEELLALRTKEVWTQEELLKLLVTDVKAWNNLRKAYPQMEIDFSGLTFDRQDLRKADFSGINL